MNFGSPLIEGVLIRRYKRFLADVELENGRVVTAHCPNSGSMKMCATPGWRVLLSPAEKPKRKLKFTWELVHNGRCWIGINTQWPNVVAAEAICEGRIPELGGYEALRREVRYGENSRIDILLEDDLRCKCFVEVKNVTLVGEDGRYCFPDAVTERGRKHLHELSREVSEGNRAVMLYVIQRSDGSGFRAAHEIDPAYAKALTRALNAGVEVLAYRAKVSPEGIWLDATEVVEC